MRALLALVASLAVAPALAGEMRLATWNIRNLAEPGEVFGDGCCARREADYGRLRAVAAATAAEVFLIQEAASPAALAEVFPVRDYVLCFGSSQPACLNDAGAAPPPSARNVERERHLAVAIRRDAGIAVRGVARVESLAVAPEGGWAEHPGLSVSLERGGRSLTLLNLHLAGCYDGPVAADAASRDCRAMAMQVEPLRAWIGERGGRAFALAGDMNRRFGREEGRGALWQQLAAGVASLARPDLARPDLARPDLARRPCWPDDPDPSHAFSVDWIIAGGGAGFTEPSRRIGFDEVTALSPLPSIEEGRRSVSDHCPVVAVLRF